MPACLVPGHMPVQAKASMARVHMREESSSLLCRFLWVVQYFVGAGFYVVPAYQPADFSADNTVVSVPGMFLRNWANLWAAITDLPNYSNTLKVC